MALPAPGVIYMSPRGKRCVLVPHGGNGKPWLYFRYLDQAELSGEGFPLSWANFRLLREAARQGGSAHIAPPHGDAAVCSSAMGKRADGVSANSPSRPDEAPNAAAR
jgi:hypothetical protein